VEGIINPLAVRDPWRCSRCGNEWLDYDVDGLERADDQRACPRCESTAVAPIRG